MSDTVTVDWDAVFVRVLAFRAADKQVRSVAPDMGIDELDDESLAAVLELISTHHRGAIDLDAPEFENTWHLLFNALSAVERKYPVDLLVTDA